MIAVGLDVGSLSTKAVVMGDDGILSSAVVLSSDSAEASAKAALRTSAGQDSRGR